MKLNFISKAALLSLILFSSLLAQSRVTVSVDTKTNGTLIPNDFLGLSFEMGSMRVGNAGVTGNFFDDASSWPSDQHLQVITLFNTLGLKHIRMGGGSVDMGIAPTTDDINAFFRFVKAAGLKVAYSFRLLNGSITEDTTIAKYVWNNYKDYIDCFSIGNEPDWQAYKDTDISGWTSYIDKWKRFASAITTAVPGAKYGGPDTGSNYPVAGAKNTDYTENSWTELFAYSEKKTNRVKTVYLHNYVGQSASGTPQQMVDKMLSSNWVNIQYPALYNATCLNVMASGFPYRLTESNSFSGEVQGGSNSYASSLFSLDYLHWWAEHKAAGVNFHNKQWLYNNTITKDAAGDFQVYPMAYGIKAFDIGGHGETKPLSIENPDTLNLTAYAVKDTNFTFITLINKEHGSRQRTARVQINLPSETLSGAQVMMLTSDSLNVTATGGVTLGGAAISNSGPWEGKWTQIDSVNQTSLYINVPYSAAAIVKIASTTTSVTAQPGTMPGEFSLLQNYPNPFNPSTTISYMIPEAGVASLRIYNILGQEVRTLINEYYTQGSYHVQWDGKDNSGRNVPGGVYIYSLSIGTKGMLNKKMVLLK